jgi:spore coat polysaccharide biosynthesis protein SpsF
MKSSRLPGKVLMPLAGAPLLQRLLERLRASKRLDVLMVATTSGSEDDAIAALCRRLGIACYRGSENDVLDRVIEAARLVDADIIVRLTADNPMVGADLVDLVVGRFLESGPVACYVHSVEGSGFPYGLFVEAVARETLERCYPETDAEEREHVTLHLRRHPERYPAIAVKASQHFALDRVSIDTADEYQEVAALFEQLYRSNPDFGVEALPQRS